MAEQERNGGDEVTRVWEQVRAVDAEYVDRYEELAGAAVPDGVLDAKTVELVSLAAHAACTTVFRPGIRYHVGAAFDEGASLEEVMDVLEMVSAIGIHAVTEGVPVLVEELPGSTAVSTVSNERKDSIRDTFEEERGYWDEMWENLLHLDPDFMEAYLNYSAHPWRNGALEPIVREFALIAADASASHLYTPGLRIHVRNAIDLGAEPEQLMAVIELASLLGANTVVGSMPIVLEEARRRDLISGDMKERGDGN